MRPPSEWDPPCEWNEAKRAANRRAHGVDFAAAQFFDWDTAAIFVDDREDYGELREMAIGFIGARMYVLVFTVRHDVIRIISLRTANKSDMKRYEKALG